MTLWYNFSMIRIPQFCLKHAAFMIGVSSRTVRRWTHNGTMSGYRVGGRQSWYYDLKEINDKRELYALPPLSVDDAVNMYNEY